jgi:Domain of unknown function (DUF4286)
MIIYSVTINVKKDSEVEWLHWMKSTHIPDILKSGNFSNYKIFKILIPTGLPDESTFVVQYETDSFEKYKNYSETEAARLQRAHAAKFLDKITTARAIMEEI